MTQPVDPKAVHEARLRSAREELARLDRAGALIANGRAVTFLGALALLVVTGFDKLPALPGYGGALLALVAYVALAVRHNAVLLREERARLLVQLSERGLGRLDGSWRTFDSRGDRFLGANHLYAADLDVYGQGSLFQLLDETATRQGEALLAEWLGRGAAPAVVKARQAAVQALAEDIAFREELLAEAKAAAKGKTDVSAFLRWAESSEEPRVLGWVLPLGFVLPVVTLTLYVLGDLRWVPPVTWLGAVLVGVLVNAALKRTLDTLYAQVSLGERGLFRFDRTFARLERQTFTDPHLLSLWSRLKPETRPPVSDRLRRFARLHASAAVRESGQLHAILQALLLWDVHVFTRALSWRRAHGAGVRAWFETLAELEALCSLAALRFARPDWTFPEVDDRPARMSAEALAHPLLDAAVTNDVALPAPGAAMLVTGSNMSGKTTLLRAMGANTVLALAGGPVRAARLEVSAMAIVTSMRVKDSLERGVSYFYAEVQRLKAVLDEAQRAHGRVLFLLDEILLGTNTAERQVASRQVLQLLLSTGAIGAVTTHDLSLTQAADGARVKNVHFRDVLESGQMTFDYRLREGVVSTTNALRVLRDAGIPVPEQAPRG